jgi:hypothetical protein
VNAADGIEDVEMTSLHPEQARLTVAPACLSRSGRCHVEPIASMRDERWLSAHRFDLPTALRLARSRRC